MLNYKEILGGILIIVAFVSIKLQYAISVQNYHANIFIPVSILLGLIGFILIIRGSKDREIKKEISKEKLLEKIWLNSEKIILNLNNCEIKENNYYEEITNNGFRTTTIADALYDPNRNVKQNFVKQTAIIFYYKSLNIKIKMVSQIFPYDIETLKDYINAGLVVLYVNKNNQNQYVFKFNY